MLKEAVIKSIPVNKLVEILKKELKSFNPVITLDEAEKIVLRVYDVDSLGFSFYDRIKQIVEWAGYFIHFRNFRNDRLYVVIEPLHGGKLKNPDSKFLYHVFPKKYFKRIKKQGLIPRTAEKINWSTSGDRIYFLYPSGGKMTRSFLVMLRNFFHTLGNSMSFPGEDMMVAIADIGEDRSYSFYEDPALLEAVYTKKNVPPQKLMFMNYYEIEQKIKEMDKPDERNKTVYERAFHGSAEPLKDNRFIKDKIGTGMGNNTFGYGFYFSDSESVANSYVRGGYKGSYSYKGRSGMKWYEHFKDVGDYNKASIWEYILLHKTRSVILHHAQDEEWTEKDISYLMSLPEKVFAKPAGLVYEVELNVEPHELLDWDKSFTEQSSFVRERIEKFRKTIEDVKKKSLDSLSGQDIYYSFERSFEVLLKRDGASEMSTAKKTSELLRENGIKGIVCRVSPKYCNYVVFDESDIHIINSK